MAAVNEGQGSEADRQEKHAVGNDARFAAALDQSSRRAPLNNGANDSAIRDQIAGQGLGRFRVKIQMKILGDQKTQSGFERGKAERSQEKDADEQPDFWMRQRVHPLSEMWPAGDVVRTGLPALGQDEQGEDKIQGAKSCRYHARALIAEP